jgi:hypothetical protein
MKFGKTLLACVGTASIWTSMAAAGPYSDDLAKCLVKSTTKEDRVSLIRWLFAAASRHPAVSSIAKVSAAQLDEANKTIGELTMKLLTDSCKAEAQKAIQYEGLATLQLSFQVLGQVAGQELFASPEVAAGMAGLQKYLDGNQLKALAGTK